MKTAKKLGLVVALGSALALAFGAGAIAGSDFGSEVESELAEESRELFGVKKPLAESSQKSITAAEAAADPTRLVTLAKGLEAEVVTTTSGPNTDMMALWPNSQHPTHIINCNEQGPAQPGIQRIDLTTGAVQTIVTGLAVCDPSKQTPWGHHHRRRGDRKWPAHRADRPR